MGWFSSKINFFFAFQISDSMTAMQLVGAALANFMMIYLFCMIGDLLEQQVGIT